MAETQEVYEDDDEFSAAEEAQAALSGYEATRTADAEDQREYRLIPAGTPCTLGIQGFTLQNPKPGGKNKPAIAVKIEVNEPEEYADGSSNFTARLSLNPVVGDGKQKSGWDMLVSQLQWMYAAVNQVSAKEGKAEMIDCVLAEFPNLDPDDVPAFHAALVQNANEKLKGTTFKTKGIGVNKGQDNPKGGQYPDRQEFGKFDYPKAEKK